MMPPPIKQEPGIGSSIPLEVISEHCCSARVILEWNHWWASVSQPVHLPRALLMPGIDAQTQKMVAALKNLNLIRLVNKLSYWIHALGGSRNPTVRHLAQDGRDRTST